MKINWNIFNRKTHYWGAIVCALPVLIVLSTGILLLLKKQSDWIQPPTSTGSGTEPAILFARVLSVAKTVPEAQIQSWRDIDRLDVRPDKGVIKIRSTNHWEVQIDHRSGDILQVAYRRSDIIESIHDGSFFHSNAGLWVFLPASLILLVLWLTGMYLFVLPILSKINKRNKRERVRLTSAG